MDTHLWQLVLILLDLTGVLIFLQLFLFMLPRTKRWRGDPLIMGSAFMKLALCIMFLWLLLADIMAVFDMPNFIWLNAFPTRSLGLRLILILPGGAFWIRFIR